MYMVMCIRKNYIESTKCDGVLDPSKLPAIWYSDVIWVEVASIFTN